MPAASDRWRIPHKRPITGSCGLSSGSRKNALPASRGARSVEMPRAVRAPSNARPVDVEGSAIWRSLTELPPRRLRPRADLSPFLHARLDRPLEFGELGKQEEARPHR